MIGLCPLRIMLSLVQSIFGQKSDRRYRQAKNLLNHQ